MIAQRADIRIISNWRLTAQPVAVVEDNGNRENRLLETDNLAIDEHVRGLDKSIEF